jgi:hypothetical protein
MKNDKNMRIGIGILVLFLLILTGCAPAEVVNTPTDLNPAAVESQTPEIAPTDTSRPDVADSVTQPNTSEQQPTKTPLQTDTLPVLPKEELQATDPTTVSLASGKPTLVEFFAFW